MFSEEVIELLKQVIMSWQVLAVTAVLVFYIFLVNRAARRYSRPRMKKEKIFKRKFKSNAPSGPEAAVVSSDTNEELGLEEK